MTSSMKLPHRAWVLVADARKALLLVNKGDEMQANLEIQRVLEAPPNPPTHEQGTDRPGRTQFGSRRSAVGQTDWHDQSEDQFAMAVVEALLEAEPPGPLVLVAPPHFLAGLRKHLPAQARDHILAEINKDLTHLTAYQIERSLTAG
jgi:protein required for attachment to host cells